MTRSWEIRRSGKIDTPAERYEVSRAEDGRVVWRHTVDLLMDALGKLVEDFLEREFPVETIVDGPGRGVLGDMVLEVWNREWFAKDRTTLISVTDEQLRAEALKAIVGVRE